MGEVVENCDRCDGEPCRGYGATQRQLCGTIRKAMASFSGLLQVGADDKNSGYFLALPESLTLTAEVFETCDRCDHEQCMGFGSSASSQCSRIRKSAVGMAKR